MHIPSLNMLDKTELILNDVLIKLKGDDFNFLTVAPHCGLYIPKDTLAVLDVENAETLNELFNDGDPYTGDFNFVQNGGVSINAVLHRAVGDLNRKFDNNIENGAIRRKSFRGYDLCVNEYPDNVLKELESYHAYFLQSIRAEIDTFHKRFPQKKLFFAQIHSMDEVRPIFYGEQIERPDLCVIAGAPGVYIDEDVLQVLMEELHDAFPNLDIRVNDPFNAEGNNHELLHLFANPTLGVNAFEFEINKRLYLRDKQKDFPQMELLNRNLNKVFAKTVARINFGL